MQKRILFLILTVFLSLSCILPVSYAQEGAAAAETEVVAGQELSPEELAELKEQMMIYFDTLLTVVEQNYKFGITKEELYKAALAELIGTDEELLEQAIEAIFPLLDENSSYMKEEKFDSFVQSLEDTSSGVGIVVGTLDNKVVVVGFPSGESPAKEAGILEGDVLLSVDGQDITGFPPSQALSMVRGPVGSQVKLGFARRGVNEPLYFTLTRVQLTQSFVHYSFIDDILYLQLLSFNEGCAKEIETVLKEADKRGVTKVIFDLRYNSGGYGNEAFAIGSLFVPKDKILTQISYKKEEDLEVHRSTAAFTKNKYDVAVLVNEYSASASELVSGAIQDNGVGKLIGTNTYGKGTMQMVIDIVPFNAGMRLTIAQYLTPNGRTIPKSGLIPDIPVKNSLEYVNESDQFEKMTFERKLFLGDSGADVKACRQRLALLNYYVGKADNDQFDDVLFDAVSAFQEKQGLFPYGGLDRATQLALYNAVNAEKVEVDDQFNAALAYFEK